MRLLRITRKIAFIGDWPFTNDITLFRILAVGLRGITLLFAYDLFRGFRPLILFCLRGSLRWLGASLLTDSRCIGTALRRFRALLWRNAIRSLPSGKGVSETD